MSNTLYRDPRQGMIAGICAGVSQYLGVELWIVRIIAVSLFLIGFGFIALLVYVAMWFMLEKKPAHVETPEPSFEQSHNLKDKPWQKGQTPAELLAQLETDFEKTEQRIRKLEAYVTSDAYRVRRDFENL